MIRWGASTGATQYRLYRGASSDSTLTLITTVSATSTTPIQYVDAGLIANVTYRYQLEAVNARGTSEPTAIASVTIPVSAFAPIENQETVTRSIGRNGQQFFRVYVPENTTDLVVTMTGDPNVDLLVQLNRQPTINSFNCRATGLQAVGQLRTRTCLIRPVISGDWHIMARSTAITSVTYTLSVLYSTPVETRNQWGSAIGTGAPLPGHDLPQSTLQEKEVLDQDRRRRSRQRPE